jgi:hypothetical protein
MWERESLAAFKLALDVVNAKGITSKNLDRVDMLTLRDKSCRLSKVTGDSCAFSHLPPPPNTEPQSGRHAQPRHR